MFINIGSSSYMSLALLHFADVLCAKTEDITMFKMVRSNEVM